MEISGLKRDGVNYQIRVLKKLVGLKRGGGEKGWSLGVRNAGRIGRRCEMSGGGGFNAEEQRSRCRVPELRFKGFDGEWEEKRLGDCVVFSKGKGYSKADIREGGAPLFLYGRMYTHYQVEVDKVDIFCMLREGSVLSKGNEVVCPASGETAEDIACASAVLGKGIVFGGDLNILTPQKGIDVEQTFLALYLTYGDAKSAISERAQGKTVVHVHNSDLGDLTIAIPSLSEQRKIGAYFRSLDALLAARREEIGKLKDLKKALLERMFV